MGICNSTYGAGKDKYNALFDPLMANNVCITGQLLLLDLIDKLEQRFGNECELVQSNTDGILVKLPDSSYYDDYVNVCKEWEKRTRLDLEHDVYVKVYQKDVNNYIIVDEKGKYKSKGAYVKKLNDLDYNLPIVNKALINKLIYNIPVEETINNCNDLKEFQNIVKVGRDYEYAMFGDNPLSERVFRVFASTDSNDGGIFKYRNGKADKVGNTPEVSFIYNDSVNGVLCPSKLDRQWYIDLANKRYEDFMEREKSIDGLDVYELIDDSYTDFTKVIIDLNEKSIHKPKDIKNLISMGYFNKFGSTRKLSIQYELFKQTYTKKTIAIDKLLEYGIDLELASSFGKVAKKNVTQLDGAKLYNYLVQHIGEEEYPMNELVSLQLQACGRINYINENINQDIVVVVKIHDNFGNIVFDMYRVCDGKLAGINVNKDFYKENYVSVGDVIRLNSVTQTNYGIQLVDYSLIKILK